MYYIEQVEGSKVEAAQELLAAVKAEDFETARAIFERETGKKATNGNESVWWIYNADRVVRSSHSIPAQELSKIFSYYRDDYARTLTMAKAAQRIHGGRWQVQYEY
jgi:hypothetical protein